MTEGFIAIVRPRLPFLAQNDPIPPDAVLADLGLDSLQTVSLLLDLEDFLGISLPDSVVGNLETFRTLQTLWDAVQSATTPAVG